VTAMVEARILAARHDALLQGYTGLVRYIAYHLFRRRNYVDVDDLIDAGMVGLSENIHRHGYDTAGRFQADVSICVRAAMLDFVRNADWSLRASRGGRRISTANRRKIS
jgi:DNA-directed RNA polymerase specialized sigma subunit